LKNLKEYVDIYENSNERKVIEMKLDAEKQRHLAKYKKVDEEIPDI